MSTCDGHSLLQALHWRQRSSASKSVSLARPSPFDGQLAAHHQAEGIGPAAGRVHLVAGDHVAGAHRAGAGLAAGADARAHLDRAGEAPLAGEVEERLGRLVRMIVRADPQVVAGVGVADDLVGVEPVLRVEGPLDLHERRVDLGAEELAVPEAAGQAVAVLAAHRAAELDHQVGDLAGDRPQRLHALGRLDVDDRPDVQAADVGVAIARGRARRAARRSPRIGRRTPAAGRG